MGSLLRRPGIIVSLLVLVLTAAACGAGPQDPPAGGEDGPPTTVPPLPPDPVAGGTVTVAQWTAPTGIFNPWVAPTDGDRDIAALIFGTLLEWAASGDAYAAGTPAALAEDYRFSDDGLELTFRLKEGIRWHDGRPFTADDVVFTFRSLMHPDFRDPRRLDFVSLRGAGELQETYAAIDAGPAGDAAAAAAARAEAWQQWSDSSGAVEAVDPGTVVFRFDFVHGPVLGHIGTAPILARHQFEGIAVADWAGHEASRQPVGTGPFLLADHSPGRTTTLRRFEDYPDRPAYLDQIVFRVVDPAAVDEALAAGEVDLAGAGASTLTPEQAAALEGLPGVEVWQAPGFGYQFLFINLNQPRFQDPEVRRALAHAIDRQALVDRLLLGRGRVVDNPLPPGWRPDGPGPYPYDPGKARNLLEAAGWTDADGDGVRERDLNGDGRIDTMGCGAPGYGDAAGALCETLSVRLLYPAGDDLRRDAALLIANWLNAVGFDVRTEAVGFDTMVQRVLLQAPRDYDLGLLGWELGADPDQLAIWRCGELYNFVDFCEDTVGPEAARAESLAEAGLAAYDAAQRRAAYNEWANVLHQQLPYVFLFSPDSITAATHRVQGVNRDFRGALHNARDWWVVPEQP